MKKPLSDHNDDHSCRQLSSGEPLQNNDVSARKRARAADRCQMQSVHTYLTYLHESGEPLCKTTTVVSNKQL